MRYLVGADVLSEPTRRLPNPKVAEWLRHNEREIAVDPIILGELRFGILLLPNGRRRASLERWFEVGVQKLRCLPWEAETGLRWAQLLANLRAAGRAMPIKDSLIAATALVHGLTVVTRNRVDFERPASALSTPSGNRRYEQGMTVEEHLALPVPHRLELRAGDPRSLPLRREHEDVR